MKRSLSIILCLFISLTILHAQNITTKQEEKKRIEDEISFIDKQLRTTNHKQKESTNTLILTKKKIETRKNLIDRLDNDIKIYENNIYKKDRDITRLENKLDTLENHYERLVYTAYKNRDAKVWFMYIMASNSISQGYRRWEYLKQITSTIKKQANNIRESKVTLSKEKEELLTLKLSSTKTLNKREQEYKTLTDEERTLTSTIKKLKRDEKKYKSEIAQKKREADKLNKEIEKLLAAAARDSKKVGRSKEETELSVKFGENKGKLPWPVNTGIIAEKFGQSFHPVFKNIKLPFNNGINISTDPNSKVKSIFDGLVKQVIVVPGYNQCVLVSHGEYFTFYCKLKKVNIKGGDKIKIGDQIGIVDDSEDGNSILHFEIWKESSKQNPQEWLSSPPTLLN